MTITLLAKTGAVELDDATIESMQRIWPTKDVVAELEKMALRLRLMDPAKRPVYFWVAIRNWMRKSPDVRLYPAPTGAGWWRSNDATVEMGADLGVPARPGEEMAQYRERLSKAIAEKRKH